MLRLNPQELNLDAAKGDALPRRTLAGVALQYGVEAVVSDGQKVRFEPGALPLEGKKPKMYLNHDSTSPIGLVTARELVGDTVMFEAKISETTLGNEALELAKDGVLDSVSVGILPVEFSFDEAGTMVVTKADWQELSLLPYGAFEAAKVQRVAASIHQEPDEIELNNTQDENEELTEMENTVETPAVIEAATVQTIFATAKREFKMPTAAEYISAFMVGGDQFHAMRAGIQAAAPDVLTSDIPGVLPLPIVQPVYNNFIGRRPVIDAIGAKAMPQGGKVFIRPEVTTHTSIGNQATENSALTQGTFVVTDNQVTKGTYGGYVTLSEQSIDWSTPEIISLVLDDMSRIYANETDNVAADNLKTGATVTSNFTAASGADPSYWSTWIAGAATTILSGSNGNLPTHLFVSPDYWSVLMGLSDTADRPLFPQIGPMNAFGNLAPGQVNGVAFGLQVVVDRNFADNTIIVGDASGYEIFEQQKGAISIDVPSTLSRTIAFRGYLATLMIDASKFVKAVMV
jgi:uncharacterized protein